MVQNRVSFIILKLATSGKEENENGDRNQLRDHDVTESDGGQISLDGVSLNG